MILPTLRQLQYLVAVVDLRHFGQAAQRCFVTQSTLSAGIQDLEHILGAALIERTKRKVLPTPLGRDIAAQAKDVLNRAESLVDAAKGDTLPLSGRFRLGVIPTIGPFVLPWVLPELRHAYPDLRLYLREEQTARLLENLQSGDLDAALLALPYELGGMESVVLAEDPFWVACPKDHSLVRSVGKGAAIDAGAILVDDLLLLEDGHCLRDHALSACHLEDAKKRPEAFQATSLLTLVQMVANGLGVTFLPEIALNSEIVRTADIVVRPLGGTSAPRYLGLVWRRSSRHKKEMNLLADFLRRALADFNAKYPAGDLPSKKSERRS
ncbi:hydrogen peroxide-inducible genes activator [Varunaivibrio sulfuroxidans]|uniref:LysR family hydrogen peroxide-inducible transcriptional activator n=1 Tax=Varunaivibrio sulfuroxidans TaxID=1773489 RepID=A0A4R3J9M6_9PROT|nr:hydrogen peroxide-inducible genes activator [Varunaivibrio sulfuroxidans]TCS61290.1 LysR family hydrogen peroxide-inducible transcriptional activator [Varunaivibrio sulfuroxidans]